MTGKEIIKALECCLPIYVKDCANCPYFEQSTPECQREILKDALDIINRLETENENYSHNIKNLTAGNKLIWNTCQRLSLKCEEIRAEVVREFADILAEKFIILFNLEYNQAENIRRIVRQMAKEMVGEDK